MIFVSVCTYYEEMKTTHKYKNPPLFESVFELFYTTKSWSSIVPGKFYDEVKDKFPKTPQNRERLGVMLNDKELKIGDNNLIQYKNEKKDTIIQLSQNLLTVNKLPKYEGWEKYVETIVYAVNALKRVLELDNINRIGLKVINKIDIQSHSLESLKKYLTIYPTIPKNLLNKVNGIRLTVESPLIENEEVLLMLLNTLQKEENYEAPIMFQLYITRISKVPEDYKDWLEHAHSTLHKTFIESLTDFCKKQFDDYD